MLTNPGPKAERLYLEPPYWLELGPARLTIMLMQRGAENSITALDRRTLDVVLVHS